jgi:hypothetical protein
MQRLVIPREIIWLNGPPGSGKGANLGFVKRIRGLSRSITMSAMLERNPEAQAIIRQGGLVPDEVVGDALLQQVSIPEQKFLSAEVHVKCVDGVKGRSGRVRTAERHMNGCAGALHAHMQRWCDTVTNAQRPRL